MKTTFQLFVAVFALVLLAACNGQYFDGPPEASPQLTDRFAHEKAIQQHPVQPTMTSTSTTNEYRENTVKTAQLGFEVDDYFASMQRARQHIGSNGAFVALENEVYDECEIRNTLRIRVPNMNFNALLDSLQALASNPKYRKVTVNDVTVELYELGVKIEDGKVVHGRLDHLVDDMQSVDGKYYAQGKANAAKAAVNANKVKNYKLEEAVAFSTITVVMTQVFEQPDAPGQLAGIGDDWNAAFVGGLSGVMGFVVGLTAYWPLLLILSLLAWFTRSRWKPLLKRKPAIATEPNS